MNDMKILEGLDNNQIISLASEYNPGAATNNFGSTEQDILRGDYFGYANKKRKAAYRWVKEHPTVADNASSPPETTIKQNKDNKELDKIIDKVNKKLHHVNKLLTELNTGSSTNPADSKNLILTICKEVKEMLSSIKAPDDKVELINKLISEAESTEKTIEAFTIISSAPQQQPAAAYNNGYGFNIGNFIKPQAQQQQTPMQQQQPIPMQQQHQVKPTVFPHQICGLTQEQIAEEVGKHVKLIPKENRNYTIHADVLYDLVNNKLLSRKMKELDCKHRANNPYLTQVNINEYIGEPELLAQYPLCFTMPCNDKKKLIMVLFNPNPVMDKNGILQYPLHIFKATKTNNANK